MVSTMTEPLSRPPAICLLSNGHYNVLVTAAGSGYSVVDGTDVTRWREDVTCDCCVASEIPKSNACMVVDIDMPEMTGIEMCKVLKGAGHGLPAILITGRTDARTRLEAEQAEAVAVLFKPFDEEPLLDAIGRALALSTRDPSGV